MKVQPTPLELDLLALAGSDRNGCIIARHYGLDGRGGTNFRVIGDEVGLTRERVRQIVQEAKALKRHKGTRMPTLDRAIALTGSCLPARAADVEKQLCAEGLTSRPFRLEGIFNAARMVGRRLSFAMSALGQERFILRLEFDGFARIRLLARERVRQYGMARVPDLLTDNADSSPAEKRERRIVETALSAEKDLQWLDDAHEWFWFSEARGNLLLRRIRKMLCVANPLAMEDLRANLIRMGNGLAPDAPLVRFCRQAPGIAVEGSNVRTEPRSAFKDALNPTERDIFRILSEHGGSMTNSELISRANDLGIKRPTFFQCVSHSPIVSRNRGHYQLIGAARLGDSRPDLLIARSS